MDRYQLSKLAMVLFVLFNVYCHNARNKYKVMLHSGRKSTRSSLSDMGVPYHVIQMVIGHVSEDMTDTYIIPDPQRLTDALNSLYKTVPPLDIKVIGN